MELKTSSIRRKNPINRNNFFFSPHQYDFQMSIGMEYVNKIINQTVIVYEVDMEKTNKSVVYEEAKFKDITFKQPVEINVMYCLDDHEVKTYDSTAIKGYYVNLGKLEFNVFEKELEENDCDIKRGDYIGLQVTPEHIEYFTVTDDGRVNYDNEHTLYGTVPYFRTVKCSVVNDVKETESV